MIPRFAAAHKASPSRGFFMPVNGALTRARRNTHNFSMMIIIAIVEGTGIFARSEVRYLILYSNVAYLPIGIGIAKLQNALPA